MKPSPSRGKVRYTTAVVLCVWLLALGTGLAHACLCMPEPAHHAGEGDHPPHPAQAVQPLVATERISPCPAFDPGPPSAWQLRPLSGSARQTGPAQQQSPKPAHAGPLRAAVIKWHAPGRVERMPGSDGSSWMERPVSIRFMRLLI